MAGHIFYQVYDILSFGRNISIIIAFTKVDHADQLFPPHLLSRLVVLRLVQDPHWALGEVGEQQLGQKLTFKLILGLHNTSLCRDGLQQFLYLDL